MSDGLALVRFGDGAVLVAWYASDPEYVVPLLFPVEDVPKLLHHGADALGELEDLASNAPSPSDDEPVTIWADVGAGWAWTGRGVEDGCAPDRRDGPLRRE